MVVDTSAVVAILLGEGEREDFSVAIAQAPHRLMSAATVVECVAVLAGRGANADPVGTMNRFADEFALEIVAIDAAQWRASAEALVRFGKGRHPAKLNLGDSFAYGLAKVTGEPLLYKGGDFTLTDTASAL